MSYMKELPFSWSGLHLLQQYGEHKELEYEHKIPDMHRCRWKNGDWTDDSDQMILIMQSLVDKEGQV